MHFSLDFWKLFQFRNWCQRSPLSYFMICSCLFGQNQLKICSRTLPNRVDVEIVTKLKHYFEKHFVKIRPKIFYRNSHIEKGEFQFKKPLNKLSLICFFLQNTYMFVQNTKEITWEKLKNAINLPVLWLIFMKIPTILTWFLKILLSFCFTTKKLEFFFWRMNMSHTLNQASLSERK